MLRVFTTIPASHKRKNPPIGGSFPKLAKPNQAIIHLADGYQAAFFASPRYVSMTFGLVASSCAGPSSASSPVSMT